MKPHGPRRKPGETRRGVPEPQRAERGYPGASDLATGLNLPALRAVGGAGEGARTGGQTAMKLIIGKPTDAEILDALDAYVRKHGGLRIHTGNYDANCGGIRVGGKWGDLRAGLETVRRLNPPARGGRSVADETRCKANKHTDGWRATQCTRLAARDGFCSQHHPDARATRRKASSDKWKKQQGVYNRQCRITATERAVIEAAEQWRDGTAIGAGLALSKAIDALQEARK